MSSQPRPDAIDLGILYELHNAARRANSAAILLTTESRGMARKRALVQFDQAFRNFVHAYERLSASMRQKYEPLSERMVLLRLDPGHFRSRGERAA